MLLHLTSLPGGCGSGDLGPQAYRFIDWLVKCGVSVWQMLPITPAGADGSPYLSNSVHAGDVSLISLDLLVREGWLDAAYLESFDPDGDIVAWRGEGLRQAWAGFTRHAIPEVRSAYNAFIQGQSDWLDEYALYQALHVAQGHAPWQAWPEPLRRRDPRALSDARHKLGEAIEIVFFQQFMFFWQWHALKTYANRAGVLLFGDMPIFVAADSAEVWVQPACFNLDEAGCPRTVAGVPPDYFSATGQYWGNPLYAWEYMRKDGFMWWKARLESVLGLFDLVRIDHFRGFDACWSIPAEDSTAENGQWEAAPGVDLFDALQRRFGHLPVVAEDLGTLSPSVHALRERYQFPGMRILQFAFDGGVENPYLPCNHKVNAVVYTGTHDNSTTRGWFEAMDDGQKEYIYEMLGRPEEEMPWALTRSALASVARLAVIPMQDVLGMGDEARMNTPGTAQGNWQWRFEWDDISESISVRFSHLIGLYNRRVSTADGTQHE